MNLIWRFYLDQQRLWRWQQLTFNLDVVAESPKGYKEYEGCVEKLSRILFERAWSRHKPNGSRRGNGI